MIALAIACASCSGLSVAPTSSQSSTSPSTTTSAGTDAPSPPSAPPDATLADLAHITIPAYCDRPATTLTSGAASTAATTSPSGASSSTSAGAASSTPSGVRVSGRGEVITEGPTAPVLVDVTGDGAKEAVAEYRCDAGGTVWPSMIVIVRQGGDVLGHVKLGDIARTERAEVTSWHPQERGLSVGWVAFEGSGVDKRPYENLLALSGAALSFAPTERGRALGLTTIVDGPEATSFVLPTGKVACTLTGPEVTCAVAEPAWTGKAECSGTVDAVALVHGRAAYACSGGAPFRAAAGDGAPPWQRQGSDPSIHGNAGEMAGLAFGRTLTTGEATCTAATDGVTCTDSLSGHGFTVSPEAVRTF